MRKLLALSTALILIGSLSASAETEGYDSRSYARLSYVSGEVHVQRPGDMGYEAGTVNLALVEGDKLGTQNGRAEVSFGRMNSLRLDGLSQVEFINLPRGEGEPFKLHFFSGSLYLRISRLSLDKEFEVHTPDASLYVLTEGLFRVDVLENQQTRFSAIEGEAEAAGEEKSFTLRSGQSLAASNGQFLSSLESSSASLDDFSRWNQSRDGLMARNKSGSSYLPEELYEYESELDEYGDWRYEADYGYVWVPRIRYYNDWRPYYYGRWVWYPVIGWTWVADEPWGWCVSHYGRWHWSLLLGWYWIPTPHWGPAWVHWYWDHQYVGWCALNWWNRPTVIIDNHFYGRYSFNDYSVHNRAMTVVHRRELQAPRAAAVALRGDSLSRIGRVTLSARQPAIAPDVTRSGRLASEASRTFLLSRGRSVERTFNQDAGRERMRLPEDRQRAIRSPESAPGSLPRAASSRQTAGPGTGEARSSRGTASERTAGRVREYGLRGGTSGDVGRSLPSRTTTSDSNRSASDTRRVRSFTPDSGRSAAPSPRETRSLERSSRSEYQSRLSSRALNPGRTSSSGNSQDPTISRGRSAPSYTSRSSARATSPSSGFMERRSPSRSQSSWSRSSRSTPAAEPRARTSAPSTVSSRRSSSSPSYTRPSYSLNAPRARSSSARTYSSSGRSTQPRSSLLSSGGSRSTSRSFSSPRSSGRSSPSVSSRSRSSAPASRSRSSSGSRSSSSSKSGRSSRRH